MFVPAGSRIIAVFQDRFLGPKADQLGLVVSVLCVRKHGQVPICSLLWRIQVCLKVFLSSVHCRFKKVSRALTDSELQVSSDSDTDLNRRPCGRAGIHLIILAKNMAMLLSRFYRPGFPVTGGCAGR